MQIAELVTRDNCRDILTLYLEPIKDCVDVYVH